MNKAAVYVFNDEACMAFGFTMLSRYFKTREEADAYVKQAGWKFFEVVDFA